MRTKSRIITVALIIALAVGLCTTSLPAGSDSTNSDRAYTTGAGTSPASVNSLPRSGSAGMPQKDEVVYARLDSAGEVQNIYVVNHFTFEGSGAFIDYGDYTAVVNLTDLQPIAISGGEASAWTDSKEFFYQGYLAGKDVPWIYDIGFSLDGARTQPDDLAGKSGKIEIRIKTTKNGAIEETFYNNYMQQITLTLDMYKCKNIVAPDATAANVGKNRMLVFTVLPGSDADISVVFDAEDFEMAGIEVSAVPFNMNLSMNMLDVDDMLGDFVQLTDAIETLNAGIGLLQSNVAIMAEGATALKTGSAGFADGLMQLGENTGELAEASAQMQGALAQISSALGSINGTAEDSPISELALLPTGLTSLADGLDQVYGGILQLREGYAQAYFALDGALMGIPDIQISEEGLYGLYAKADEDERRLLGDLTDSYAAAMTVKATYAQVKAAFASVTVTLDTLAPSIGTISSSLRGIATQINSVLSGSDGNDSIGQIRLLADSISQLSGSYQVFHEGLVAYLQGISALSDGYAGIDSGIAGLSSGTTAMLDGIAEIHDGTSRMADESADIPELVRSEVDKLLDDYKGGDFEAVSFASGRNDNINFVQFVFVTEGISKPKVDVVYQSEERLLNFWDRLLNLFS
ncbi:MAG: hypothetical protein FWH33_00915 [Oscillospiraceae bacterium]|nr:hypothetical protein [Oscillospiraceae bacterium]